MAVPFFMRLVASSGKPMESVLFMPLAYGIITTAGFLVFCIGILARQARIHLLVFKNL